MSRQISLLSLNVLTIFLLALFSSCQSIQNIDHTSPEFYSKIKRIGIWIKPGNDPECDRLLSNFIELDWISKGYQTVNLNRLAGLNNQKGNDTLFLWLKKQEWMPTVETILIAEVTSKWVSKDLGFYENRGTYMFRSLSKRFADLPEFTTSFALFNWETEKLVYLQTERDTCHFFNTEGSNHKVFSEQINYPIKRAVSRVFNQVPIFLNSKNYEIKDTLWISVYGDSLYRKKFPDWKDKIRLRVLLASDLMERSFNTSIGIKDFVEWKDTFNIFIEHSYGNLEKAAEKQKKVFSLGYSFNPKFSENWNQDQCVGVAGVFDRKIMVISQPSFPGMEIWSPVDEALTIVHELGHSLGAVHVSDSNSIMYPAIGRAGFDFDTLNTRILTITLNELDFDETKRLTSYLSLMNSFFLSKFISEEACCVYSLGALNAYEQFAGMQFMNEDPIITNNTVTQYISEDSFRWTLLGYIYLKAGYYNQSVYCSEKALEVNPSLKIPAEGIKVSKKWIEFLKKPN